MPMFRVRPGHLRWFAVPALVVWGLAFIPFGLIGDPQQMIRLQLAGTAARAAEIVGAWSPLETIDMAYLQGIDSVHLLAYGVVLSAAAVWASRRYRGGAAQWGALVAWLVVAGAILDAFENVGMIIMIRGTVTPAIASTTTALAIAKFSALGIVALYVLVAAVTGRRAPTTQSVVSSGG